MPPSATATGNLLWTLIKILVAILLIAAIWRVASPTYDIVTNKVLSGTHAFLDEPFQALKRTGKRVFGFYTSGPYRNKHMSITLELPPGREDVVVGERYVVVWRNGERILVRDN
jgi:hypothetical protein